MLIYNTVIGNEIEKAAAFLRGANVIGIPTETVYGLAGNALNEDAVLKIFTVKGRPHFDPLIVHTYSVAQISQYVEAIPVKAQQLMEAFMPGPLTILLKKKSIIPDLVTSGLDAVAIRIPKHPLALELMQQLSFPLAAPSANPFGYISPTTAQHVYDQLHGKTPYILDGGPATVGVESTIIGFEDEQPVVYRLGGLELEAIESIVGKVQLNINTSSNPKAPGLLKSHYAPGKRLIFDQLSSELDHKVVGTIVFQKPLPQFPQQHQIVLSPTGDLTEAAKKLFGALRSLDNSEVEIIYAEKFPDRGLGRAINDRLNRAAG